MVVVSNPFGGVALTGIAPQVGCRFLVVDAKRKSISFYEKFGFRLLDTDENRTKAAPLMFLDLKPLLSTDPAA